MRKQDAMYRRHNGANIRIDPPRRQVQRRTSMVPTLIMLFAFAALSILAVFLIAWELRDLR